MCRPLKTVNHTQTIRRQKPTNSLSVFDHFWGLVLNGLKSSVINFKFTTKQFLS